MKLANGTIVEIGPNWCRTTLPSGQVVNAHPNDESLDMAIRLGYGSDVAALTRDHDSMHAMLTDWLGMPFSFSLAQTAGIDVSPRLASLEESAVLRVQELKARWDRRQL